MNIHGAPTRTQTHIRTSSTTPSKLVSMSLISLNGSNFRSFIGVVSSSHMRGDALFVVAPRLFKLAACGYHDFVPSGAVQSAKAFEPTEHSSRITTRANPEARWFQTASILRPAAEDGHGHGWGWLVTVLGSLLAAGQHAADGQRRLIKTSCHRRCRARRPTPADSRYW